MIIIIDAELGNFARNLPPEHEISVRTEKCLGSQFRGNFGFGNRNEKLPRTWPWMSWPRTQGRSRCCCCCCCVAADISIGAFLTNGLSLSLSLSLSFSYAISFLSRFLTNLRTYAHTHAHTHIDAQTHSWHRRRSLLPSIAFQGHSRNVPASKVPTVSLQHFHFYFR